MKRLLIILTVLFAALSTVLFLILRSKSGEVKRLNRNQTTLLSDIATYRTRLGQSAASVEALTLTVSELRRLRSADAAQIESLGLRLRRVEQYALTVTNTVVEVETVVRDTIFVGDTFRRFEWNDGWVTVEGVVRDGRVECRVESVDTLTQIVHREPYRLLCFRFGTRSIRAEVVSHNPHTQIVATELIEVDRRRRR